MPGPTRAGASRSAHAAAAGGTGVTVRVLLVDDERLVRAGFRMILSGQPGMTVVGEAADGLQAIGEVERLRPDVVLMDVRMPRPATALGGHHDGSVGDGPARRHRRVIVLTTFDLDEYVYEALRAGASGFLLKDAPEAQLVAAIQLVADGGSIFAPHATRRLVEALRRTPCQNHPMAWPT